MTTEQLIHLKNIVEHYGTDHQQDKAIEECSELIQAICKHKEAQILLQKNLLNIIDEIADVEIMLNQLKIIFDCFGEVENRIDHKINRQLERIRKGE